MGPGTVIDGRFRVVKALGSGGTATVYEVEHVKTGQRLALKTLHDPGQSARLEQEAKASARLRSPHAVRVIELGMHAGTPFLVMSLLEGVSLRDLLVERGKLDLATTANIVMQVTECLDEAHSLGLVHRDLKPDNIHLRPLGPANAAGTPSLFDVTVLDFGVVKMAYDDQTTQLTRTGSTVGTPFYMSLEQLRGASTVDAQSDVYSLSVLLYECMSGNVPFQASTLGDLVFAIVSAPPVALHVIRPELPREVSDVVMAGLSSNKTGRPASMRVIAEAFLAHADPAFSLWLRRSPDPRSLGDKPELAETAPVALAAVERRIADRAPPRPQSDPTKLGPPPAPRPPPRPSGSHGPTSHPPPSTAALGLKPPPKGLPGPAHFISASGVPIDEPSTSRDDEPATSSARDRDTPTEMYQKDAHGRVGPPDMLVEEDPSAIPGGAYPTMNLDVPGALDRSEATAVLAIGPNGPQPSPSSPFAAVPVHTASSLADTALVPGSVGELPPVGYAAPGAPPSGGYSFTNYANVPAPRPSNPGGFDLTGASPSAKAPSSRQLDDLLQRMGRSGNDISARAMGRFRASSPIQQALIVGAAAAVGAMILVAFVFLIFVR